MAPPPTKKNFLLRITWNEFWYKNFCVTRTWLLRLTLLNVATKERLRKFSWSFMFSWKLSINDKIFLKCMQWYLGVLLELYPWPLTLNHGFDLWPCTWTYTLSVVVGPVPPYQKIRVAQNHLKRIFIQNFALRVHVFLRPTFPIRLTQNPEIPWNEF